MIESITAVGLICVAMSAVYLMKNRTKSEKQEYIWVGEGKNPFK